MIDTYNDPVNMPSWMRGMQRFQSSDHARTIPQYPPVWQRDQVRCLQISTHADDNAPPLLLIPSLINRYYILDLAEKTSLARHLSHTHQVYVLDWDTPKPEQADYNAGRYITRYILPLIRYIYEMHQQPVALIGYCIGGLLSMAATQLQPEYVDRLVLLATPWDFHATDEGRAYFHTIANKLIHDWCDTQPLLPGAYMSWMFYLADTERFEAKYRHFAQLDTGCDEYEQFLQVEHWVNDTVPLTRAFAKECLGNWAQHNHTATLQWTVEEQIINPAILTCPVLIAAPQHDTIVPPQTALAAAMSPDVDVITPATGHIGMVIGSKRQAQLWQPLTHWLLKE